MTLIVNPIYDNPQIPGDYANSYYPDQLIAGPAQLVTQRIVLGGGVALNRGTVLGQTSQVTIVAAPTAGNTGNGTVGSISSSTGKELGGYKLVATSATVFSVTDPEGVALANATVGTAYTSAELNFTITAGGTAFVTGDSFTLTSYDAIGTFIVSVRTASDGSQNPTGILVDYTDASGGPVAAGVYMAGEFNINALSYDNSWTIPQLQAAMRATIFLKPSISAADPS